MSRESGSVMTEFSYTAEFAIGARAKLTLSRTAAHIEWTRDIPRLLKGQRRRRFLATYRAWRDDCIADYTRRSGHQIEVFEL
jgi:hypothetical protein